MAKRRREQQRRKRAKRGRSASDSRRDVPLPARWRTIGQRISNGWFFGTLAAVELSLQFPGTSRLAVAVTQVLQYSRDLGSANAPLFYDIGVEHALLFQIMRDSILG